MLSLDDVLKLPPDADEDHLRSLGLLPPPAPPAAPLTIGTPAAPSNVAVPAMSRPYRTAEGLARAGDTATAGPVPSVPEMAPFVPPKTPESPLATMQPPPALPNLNFKERQALPQTSPGVLPGTVPFYENKVERMEDAKANPWGSAENHPGVWGKIGHVAAKVGNIAGDIVEPGVMTNVPGTERNKQAEEAGAERKLEAGKAAELTGKIEATKEKHEANVEDINQQKIDQAEKKIDETERNHLSQREVNLRKQGLKLNPDDPNAPPVPLAYEDMSPTEQAVHDLKVAQADSQTAKALLDKVRADPNSPQSQAALKRVQIMAQNAKTAAGKLNLDQKKFVADYFGLDENGQPLPGTPIDPKTGKPVGPKISGKGGEQFVGTIGASVVQATATQDTVRRLMKMLEEPNPATGKPWKDDNQPFGTFWKQVEYRLGKAQADTIGAELAGINLSSLLQAATVMRASGSRAYQTLGKALQHTPDPTKDSTMLMHQKMQIIDRSTATFLADADKYGRKKGATIEPERMRPAGEAPAAPAKGETAAPAAATPAPPKVGDVVDGHKFKGGDPSKKENWEKVAAEKKP